LKMTETVISEEAMAELTLANNTEERGVCHLQLSGLGLDKLPPLDEFKKLESLKADHNQLKSIPASIGRLGRLSLIHLNNNQLERTIPETLGKLKRLSELHVQKNQLKWIPKEVCHAKILADLRAEANPLVFPPLGECEDPHGYTDLEKMVAWYADPANVVDEDELDDQGFLAHTISTIR